MEKTFKDFQARAFEAGDILAELLTNANLSDIDVKRDGSFTDCVLHIDQEDTKVKVTVSDWRVSNSRFVWTEGGLFHKELQSRLATFIDNLAASRRKEELERSIKAKQEELDLLLREENELQSK